MHHIILYLCRLLSARILTYTSCVQCMWDLKSKWMPGKSLLDRYVSVTLITAGMLLYSASPTCRSSKSTYIMLIVILILGTTAPSAILSPDLQDILKDASYANKHSSSLPVEMGAFSSLKHYLRQHISSVVKYLELHLEYPFQFSAMKVAVLTCSSALTNLYR